MADSRRGGIEKIAHLFIAGHGASALRARDNSPRHWASPATPPSGGDGQAAGNPPIVPAPQAAPQHPNDRAAGAEAPADGGLAEPLTPGAVEGLPAAADPAPAADKPAVSPELAGLLARAKVVAVLTGQMGPLAGPAAEAIAKGLARETSSVAMLYGPAEYACLHQFTSDTTRNCNLLLLPDWVFQFDLWPAGRPVWSIAVGYGAGSEGLMAAYGALKGLISRFGRPDEVLILPFGCNEQEEAWGQERLVEMCQRFLEITPRVLGEATPELRVQASPLQPIGGGIDGIKHLLDSIGKVRLAVIKHSTSDPIVRRDPAQVVDSSSHRQPEQPAGTADEPDNADVLPPAEVLEADDAETVTVLVPVDGMPKDGQEVLQALLRHHDFNPSGVVDVWRRDGVAGTIAGSEGFIGAAGSTHDLLGFALWMCRMAQTGHIDQLASITIGMRNPDPWLIEASKAMPIPVTWFTWLGYQIEERYGISFHLLETT